MPDGTQSTALNASQEFNMQLDQQVQNFKVMLPSHVPVEKFKRVIVTAVLQDPKLFHADRRSLFMAAQKCASDGLLPDGREAVLLPFNTKVKVREKLADGTFQEREEWRDVAQYIPMVQGVRKRMRNTGLVASAEAHVVYRNDKFFQKFGSDPQIVHEPPALGTERGEAVGAYAIIRLVSGEVIQEVLDKAEIERIRSFSKNKNGPAWRDHWSEMARKTVLKRAAKSAPTSAEMLQLLDRDDEPPEFVDVSPAAEYEPEPPRQIAPSAQTETQASYIVIDFDAAEHEYTTADSVERALELIWQEAKKRGRPALDAARENNDPTLDQMSKDGHGIVVERILNSWNDHWMHAKQHPSQQPAAERSPAGQSRNEGDDVRSSPSPQAGERGNLAQRFAALAPQRVDLTSDELDWHGYADVAVALIGQASSQAEAAAYRVADNPVLQKMRVAAGDDFRRIMDALVERARAAA